MAEYNLLLICVCNLHTSEYSIVCDHGVENTVRLDNLIGANTQALSAWTSISADGIVAHENLQIANSPRTGTKIADTRTTHIWCSCGVSTTA